jgi:hypothetical protein
MQMNEQTRASTSDIQTLNQKLWNAVKAGDLAAAKAAFSMGAFANLFSSCEGELCEFSEKNIKNGKYLLEKNYQTMI